MQRGDKIFIAGHGGLVGSAVLRRLRSEGFANLLTATRNEMDLCDHHRVQEFFAKERPRFVFMCAGRVGGIIENRDRPVDLIFENLQIQINTLKAAFASGVERMIVFGSSCMYPKITDQPMAESALFTGPPEPSSLPYAVAKMAGVQMCLALNQQTGTARFLPVIPNSVFGPNDDFDPTSSHVLSALLRRFHEAARRGDKEVEIWGSGMPRREFVHADDVASACTFLMQRPSLNKTDFPMNIGVGRDMSILELARAIAKIVGYQGEVSCDPSKPDGAPQKLLDATRLNGLGWRPLVDFESGLADTYRWYLEQTSQKENVA